MNRNNRENKDSFFCPKMWGCVWLAAWQVRKSLYPHPNVFELVSIGWWFVGRHYDKSCDEPINTKYIKHVMWKQYIRQQTANAEGGMDTRGCPDKPKKFRTQMLNHVGDETDYKQHPDILDEKTFTNPAIDRDFIKHLLGKLPEKERVAVRKHYLEGFTLQEVGDQMGHTSEGIRRIIKRAIEKLQETREVRLAKE